MRGVVARLALLALAVATLASSASQNYASSGSSGGCVKGKRCGNTCISVSDTCHNGSTYKKSRRRR